MSITLPADFPPELVQEFVHHAACLSTGSCLALCRVSSWTRKLALPHLYSTVILKTHLQKKHFLECLSRSPFTSVHLHFEPKKEVRGIWVEPASDHIVSIFEQCDNLTHIALHADNLLWLFYTSSILGHNHLPHDAITRKQDLDIVIMKGTSWNLIDYIHLQTAVTTPFFNRITRLRVTTIDNYKRRLHISLYPCLTHFAVPCYLDSHELCAFRRVLEHPLLEVFVVVLYRDISGDKTRKRVQEWVQETRTIEQSLKVYVVESDVTEVQKEWEEEVRGSQSFWDKASLNSIF